MGILGGEFGLRSKAVARGRRLEYVTIVYNSLEGLVALAAGWLAGSIALVGLVSTASLKSVRARHSFLACMPTPTLAAAREWNVSP